MNIKTLTNATMYVDDTYKYNVLSVDSYTPHWGWWILWLILFYPALLVLVAMCFRKKYVVEVSKNGVGYTIELDKANFHLLKDVAKAK